VFVRWSLVSCWYQENKYVCACSGIENATLRGWTVGHIVHLHLEVRVRAVISNTSSDVSVFFFTKVLSEKNSGKSWRKCTRMCTFVAIAGTRSRCIGWSYEHVGLVIVVARIHAVRGVVTRAKSVLLGAPARTLPRWGSRARSGFTGCTGSAASRTLVGQVYSGLSLHTGTVKMFHATSFSCVKWRVFDTTNTPLVLDVPYMRKTPFDSVPHAFHARPCGSSVFGIIPATAKLTEKQCPACFWA
jgi:hypothetical protein